MSRESTARRNVLKLYAAGLKTKEIAQRLMLSKSWCRRIKQQKDQPRRSPGGGRFKLDAVQLGQLHRFVAEKSDATLEELTRRFAAEAGVSISIGALWNTLRREKLTLKKKRSLPLSKPGPTSPKRGRTSSPGS